MFWMLTICSNIMFWCNTLSVTTSTKSGGYESIPWVPGHMISLLWAISRHHFELSKCQLTCKTLRQLLIHCTSQHNIQIKTKQQRMVLCHAYEVKKSQWCQHSNKITIKYQSLILNIWNVKRNKNIKTRLINILTKTQSC